MCQKNGATLIEDERDIPYFGKVFLFSITCKACGYHAPDVEASEPKEPVKCTFTVESEEDLSVRVVNSAQATIPVPTLRMSVESGATSKGYVSNIEGVLNRFKKIIEQQRDGADDAAVKKKAKNLLKKLWKIQCGDAPCKIVIEDPSGNSAIISDKTVVSKLKKK